MIQYLLNNSGAGVPIQTVSGNITLDRLKIPGSEALSSGIFLGLLYTVNDVNIAWNTLAMNMRVYVDQITGNSYLMDVYNGNYSAPTFFLPANQNYCIGNGTFLINWNGIAGLPAGNIDYTAFYL